MGCNDIVVKAFSLTPMVLSPPSHSAATTTEQTKTPRFRPATKKSEDDLDASFLVKMKFQ